MARKHKMKVGSVKRTKRLIRGQRRAVLVKKMSKKRYLVRLAKPRVSKKRLNYGQPHSRDRHELNKSQKYEVNYRRHH